jgi:hypothetical protein
VQRKKSIYRAHVVSNIRCNNLFDRICTVLSLPCSLQCEHESSIENKMSRKWPVYNLWYNIKGHIHVSDMFSFTADLLCLYFYLHPNTQFYCIMQFHLQIQIVQIS